MESINEEITLKLIMIGQQAVGKTSIIQEQKNKEHDQLYTATIGVDFYETK